VNESINELMKECGMYEERYDEAKDVKRTNKK